MESRDDWGCSQTAVVRLAFIATMANLIRSAKSATGSTTSNHITSVLNQVKLPEFFGAGEDKFAIDRPWKNYTGIATVRG